MIIGTSVIVLMSQEFASRFRYAARGRPVRGPKLWMKRDGGVLRIESLWWGIEQSETFAGDARDHFRCYTTPGPRFSDAEQSAGARDRGHHRIGIKWFDGAQID